MELVVTIIVALFASVCQAKPTVLHAPLTYVSLGTAAPIGPDGRVLDTPEVAVAKAEHAAAQANQRIKLANEAARSGEVQHETILASQPLSRVLTSNGILVSSLVGNAPVGPDGRVVDTVEVAAAKAAHAAAQTNERLHLANEAVRSANAATRGSVNVGPEGRVLDTPEVAAAKSAHEAAYINQRINLANEAARSEGAAFLQFSVPVLSGGNSVIASVGPGAPIGPDGRVIDTAEVSIAKAAHAAAHVNEQTSLANEALKSADVLAAAGNAVAYGRLVY